MGIRQLIPVVVIGVLLAPAAAQAQEEVVYYHTDAIGSVRAITDATGAVVGRYDFLPFGELWPSNPPAPTELRQFAGKERETIGEFDLDYFGARYHFGLTGRFTTVDPVLNIEAAMTDPQRWNRYSYAVNRPFVMIDPDGRDPRLLTGGIGAAVYGTWQALLNVHQNRPWYENVHVEASKGFLVGVTLGLAAPALSAAAPATASLSTAATTFGFTKVEGVYEGFTHGRLANGAEIAARFTRAGDTLTTSILGAFNATTANAGTLNAVLRGAQAVAKEQGAKQLVIQAVGVVNPRLADILLRQGFRQTTIRVGSESINAYEKAFEVYR